MTPLALLTTLRSLAVTLTPQVNRLRVDAPAGVLTDALRHALRIQKTALLDLVEAVEERAAIAEYCSGLPRAEAEQLAWDCMLDKPVHANGVTL
jgi:TubC N-terminal docking domain